MIHKKTFSEYFREIQKCRKRTELIIVSQNTHCKCMSTFPDVPGFTGKPMRRMTANSGKKFKKRRSPVRTGQ